MENTAIARGGTLYFLTEQACCLAQACGMDTDDFRACRKAAEYLAGGDTGGLHDFDDRTGAVKHDLTGQEDYDTEVYDGKENDVQAAVTELVRVGNDPDTPDEKRVALLKAADIIADFYGVDSGITLGC